MKKPIDLARRFLTLADNDIKAFQRLAADDNIADSSVGFHAQQAVEKCLKAVLVFHGIHFRKKHDLKLRTHGFYNPDFLLDDGTWLEISLSENIAYKKLSVKDFEINLRQSQRALNRL